MSLSLSSAFVPAWGVPGRRKDMSCKEAEHRQLGGLTRREAPALQLGKVKGLLYITGM